MNFDITCLDQFGSPIEYLTQWDSNQSIYLKNPGLSEAPIIHFCNTRSKTAYSVKSELIDSDMIKVDIPNLLLQEPYRIYVYVHEFYIAKMEGKTLYCGKIDVREKTKPDDYFYVENVKPVNVIALAQQVNKIIMIELPAIRENIDDLKSVDNVMSGRIGSVESSVTSLNSKYSNQQTSITQIKADITNINSKFDTIEAQYNGLSSNIEKLSLTHATDKQNLEDKISQLEAEIAALKELIENPTIEE